MQCDIIDFRALSAMAKTAEALLREDL